jgi:hypothetical protein
MRTSILLLAAIVTSAACALPTEPRSPVVTATPSSGDAALEAARRALSLRKRGDASLAARAAEEASRADPADDYYGALAVAYLVRAGRTEDALRALEALAARRSDLVLKRAYLGALTESPRANAALAELRKNAAHARRPEVVATVREPDLLPEGIARDPAVGTLYLGSTRKRKIVAIEGGLARDLPLRDRDLQAVLGLKVVGRSLFAVTAADEVMVGYRPSDEGQSALVKFDLATGEELERWSAPPGPDHYWNDVAVDANEGAWVTDTAAGTVYLLRPRAAPIALSLPPLIPNGIALSDDGERLYVADLLTTWVVSTRTLRAQPVARAPGVSLGGFDGLYQRGGVLYGIENTLSEGRISRITLDPSGLRATARCTLASAAPQFSDPTTAALDDDSLVVLANAQYSQLGPHGQLPPAERLRDIVLVRVPTACAS